MSRAHLPSNFAVRDTYTVIRYLGSGAFGDVYQVRHRFMGIQAMKVLPSVNVGDPFAEAFILTKVGHPNIIRVFEANEFNWQSTSLPYFTMEYLAGGTLADYVDQNRPGHTARAQMCLEIASGLAIAHSQHPPIVHRDLSPWNVMVAIDQGQPTVKITDFGLAKSVDLTTRLASAAGNYVYMPPEAFWGHESTASDVFSAALVMFEVLTGQSAYPLSITSDATEDERIRLVRSSRQRKPMRASEVNPSLSTAWDNFFADALAHDAAKRIQTGRELEKQLKSVLLRPHSEADSEPNNVAGIVEEALRLSKQAVSLPHAVKLLEKACNSSEAIGREYASLLELWKRGIVQ